MLADLHYEIPDDVNVYPHLFTDPTDGYACGYLALHTGPSEHSTFATAVRLTVSSQDPAVLRRIAAGLEQLANDLDHHRDEHTAVTS